MFFPSAVRYQLVQPLDQMEFCKRRLNALIEALLNVFLHVDSANAVAAELVDASHDIANLALEDLVSEAVRRFDGWTFVSRMAAT